MVALFCCASDNERKGELKPLPPFLRMFSGEEKIPTMMRMDIFFIQAWIEKREAGDIEGAAADCTTDILVELPGDKLLVGLEEVKEKVFSKTAPKPLMILQPVQEMPGQQHVYWRLAVFDFASGLKQTKVRHEYHLVYDDRGKLKVSKVVLRKAHTNGGIPQLVLGNTGLRATRFVAGLFSMVREKLYVAQAFRKWDCFDFGKW